MDIDVMELMRDLWPWAAGGGLGWLAKSSRRKREAEADEAAAHANQEEWQVYKDQISHLSGLVKSQQDLIREMTEQHAQERRESEERFANQTDRLREVQRNLVSANEREMNLTRENGRLRLLLAHFKNWHCRKDYSECKEREPEQEMKTRYLPVVVEGSDSPTAGGAGQETTTGNINLEKE